MAAAIALQILFALKRMTKNWSGCEWNEHNIFLTKWSVLFCQICDEAIVSFPGIYSNSIQFSISKIEDGEGLNWDLFPCLSRSCIMKKAFSDSWRSLLLTKCISDDMVYWGIFIQNCCCLGTIEQLCFYVQNDAKMCQSDSEEDSDDDSSENASLPPERQRSLSVAPDSQVFSEEEAVALFEVSRCPDSNITPTTHANIFRHSKNVLNKLVEVGALIPTASRNRDQCFQVFSDLEMQHWKEWQFLCRLTDMLRHFCTKHKFHVTEAQKFKCLSFLFLHQHLLPFTWILLDLEQHKTISQVNLHVALIRLTNRLQNS